MNLTKESAKTAFVAMCERLEKYGLNHNQDAEHGAQVLIPYIWKELGLDKVLINRKVNYIFIGLSAGNYVEIGFFNNKKSLWDNDTLVLHRPEICPIVEKASAMGYLEIELWNWKNYGEHEKGCKYTWGDWDITAVTDED